MSGVAAGESVECAPWGPSIFLGANFMLTDAFSLSIARYGQYGTDATGRQIAYRDGSPVEWVEVLDVDGGVRRMTLDPSINGSRLPVGTVADFRCQLTSRQSVVYGRDGRERIQARDAWKVLEMAPAVEADAPAAP
jgi:hypothetical protein